MSFMVTYGIYGNIQTTNGAVVKWLSLLHNFIQHSNLQILLMACQRFEMVRIIKKS